VGLQAYLGIAFFCSGYPDRALSSSNAAAAEARGLANPTTSGTSLALHARLLSLSGYDTALSEQADQLVSLATAQGFLQWQAQGTIYRGWVKARNGDAAGGIPLLRNGLTAFRATSTEIWAPHFNALLAEACEFAGQIDEASMLFDDALRIADKTGEHWLDAELYRHKGQLLLRHGQSEAAEELYRKALSIGVEQEAKLWELRAAESLARLCRDQGRRVEARDLLAPVYDWFTEGFDTADLKEAKALLNDLT
jgi:predicted ATPase